MTGQAERQTAGPGWSVGRLAGWLNSRRPPLVRHHGHAFGGFAVGLRNSDGVALLAVWLLASGLLVTPPQAQAPFSLARSEREVSRPRGRNTKSVGGEEEVEEEEEERVARARGGAEKGKEEERRGRAGDRKEQDGALDRGRRGEAGRESNRTEGTNGGFAFGMKERRKRKRK
ncbi:unnamed protein product [Calypogeia fissa]